MVVPYVGTWIEMRNLFCDFIDHWVVPYVGTWIEICDVIDALSSLLSFPTWERG